jgi:hypothetical protein
MSENATDSAGDGPDSVELLEWLDGQMRAITEQIDDPPDPLLDGCEAAACVHSMPGQAVGVLEVLRDIAGGQLADRAGVGLDDHAVRMCRADGSAGAVVNIDAEVVSPADLTRSPTAIVTEP